MQPFPLGHSFRCLGAGTLPEYVKELRKRETLRGLYPDPVVSALMDAKSVEGEQHSISTDLMLRILGLEVRERGVWGLGEG